MAGAKHKSARPNGRPQRFPCPPKSRYQVDYRAVHREKPVIPALTQKGRFSRRQIERPIMLQDPRPPDRSGPGYEDPGCGIIGDGCAEGRTVDWWRLERHT